MDQPDYYRNFTIPIMTGEVDEFLDSIILAVRQRKQDMAPKIWELNIGDRVRFVNVTPKYLNGAVGTIKKVNRVKVVVDLDEKRERFFKNISTPLSMVEKV